MAKARQLATQVDTSSFEAFVELAMKQISTNPHTADAYRRDVQKWLVFCRARSINPRAPRRQEVAAWVEEMTTAEVAPKTRARRIASLCSVYRELRRELTDQHGEDLPPYVTVKNPFSVDDGPKRRKALAKRQTPAARPDVVQALLATCDGTPIGIRDNALIRILWSTGIRRMSAVSMKIEKLESVPEGYYTLVEAKRDKIVPILICGRAATALDAWLDILNGGEFKEGPLWRGLDGDAMSERMIWWMLHDRSLEAKVRSVSPHMLRAAFLTFNKASIEAKQEAAGHSDVNTTRSYDRSQWRGKEAFVAMPEIEDLVR